MAAIENGLDIIAANKGPLVLDYRQILERARAQGVQIRFSAATAAAAGDRSALASRNPVRDTTMPGKQNPHWGAPSSTSACWIGLMKRCCLIRKAMSQRVVEKIFLLFGMVLSILLN